MNGIEFIKTDDGSVGLYDKNVGDIYHSKSGALKESFDKFINPSFLKEKSSNSNKLNILDICSGTGYNLKAAISIINDNCKVCIDCLEANINLINISPFIDDQIHDIDLKILILSEVNKLNNYKYDFLIELYKKCRSIFWDDMRRFIEFLLNRGYINEGCILNRSFLHNIYYNYISNNMNSINKINKYNNINIRYFIGDARQTLPQINSLYDVVFLDAFSPQKDPVLWTINFLSLIKSKLHEKSVIVSYSKSTPFRSALIDLGFCVGKTLLDNIDMGTVASLDNSFILNPLSDYDYKLLSTRTAIPYKDLSLSLSFDEIINNRNIEMHSSDRITLTQFLKNYY